jgi:hypothetical protein
MNEIKYPDDWLCTCGHRKDQHHKFHAHRNACLVQIKKISGIHYVDNCLIFKPVDNLTHIEMSAKIKGLVDELPK